MDLGKAGWKQSLPSPAHLIPLGLIDEVLACAQICFLGMGSWDKFFNILTLLVPN